MRRKTTIWRMNFKRDLLIIVSFFALINFYKAQTKTSIIGGNWNNPFIWSPFGVPSSTDNVLIASNHQVNLTSDQACNSLTVGNGGNAYLRFDSGTNRTFTVNGNIVVATNARFRVAGANGNHTVTLAGDIINNGTINFYRNNNRNAELVLMKNGNQSISGSGIESRFYNIRLNMGSSFNNIADFSTTSFIVLADFLKLQNGTFRYSKVSAVNITPFSNAITIPSTAGLWMNSAASIMSLPNGIIVSGKLTNSNGTMNVGNGINETLLYAGGTFSFTGGVTNVAGRFNGNTAASTCNFNMSGGSFTVPSVSTNNTTEAPFQIGTAGSQFNMSGGTILIRREGGNNAQDLGYVNLAGSGTVNGGTLQIGSATSPGSQIMKINSTALIPNLVLNNSTATASLLTNAMTVTNTIKITLGTLHSNNLGITLGGNWENNGGTFTPGTSTVTFNSSSAQSIFKTGGETFNHLNFIGAGVKSFSAPVTASGNFSISSGSNVNVSSSNHQLTVLGNFINSGTFNSNNGTVLFNGSMAHTIGGSSTTNFFNLTLSNTTNGATLSNPQNLLGTLTLNGGTFNTNSQLFTMISTSAATARIAPITGSGVISGPVRVQRFVPGGSTGWALWGTPISSALSFSDWDDNIAISCPTCPDGYVPNFISIYSYNEAATGSYSNSIAYVPMNTINDAIVPNSGYWVYVGDGPTTTNGITVDVIGSIRQGNQTIPLARTNTGNPADDGWNLIHNPYPSAISWAALRNGNASVDNAIYLWNADLNGGSGASATYVNGVSSPAVGSGGIGDNIPMSQGFYVHVTANTNITATETNKTASSQAYLKSASQTAFSLLRVNMNGGPNNFSEECVIYNEPSSTINFEKEYDAYKIAGQDPYAPFMALDNGIDLLQINGIPQVSGTYTTYLKTLTGYNGTYSITSSENTLPLGTCVNLYDRFTYTNTDITSSDYVFNLSDTTTVARFILSITLNTLQITSNVAQPSCENNLAEIVAKGNNAGPWNYYWKDSQGNPIQTSLNKTTSDTLQGSLNGTYQLEVTTIGGCVNNNSSFSIIGKLTPTALFTSDDTCYLNIDPTVVFYNQSSNLISQVWNFGDSNTSTDYAPQHQYQSVGNYNVSLLVNSSTGCTDTITKKIVVMNRPVGIKTISLNDDLKVRTLLNDKYIIEKEIRYSSELSYNLKDSQGKLVLEKNKHSVSQVNIEIDLSNYEPGIYFLMITLDNKTSTIKLTVN